MSKKELFKKYQEILLKTNGGVDDYVVALCQISNLIKDYAEEKDQQICDLEAKLKALQNGIIDDKTLNMLVKEHKLYKDLETKLAESERQYETLYKLFSEQHEIIDQNELGCFEEVNRLLKEQKDFYIVEKTEYDKMKQGAKDIVKELKQQLAESEKEHELLIDQFEEETEKLRKQIKQESDARKRFVEEVKNLKQQLHDLPKKIVEDCKMALIKRINIISGYGRMTIDEQSFFFENEYGKDLDTILKKYGGEDE